MARTENRSARPESRVPFGKRTEGRVRRSDRRAVRAGKESFLHSAR